MMKQVLYYFISFVLLVCSMSCNEGIINGDGVNIDTTMIPNVYTFKNNGQKISGKVAFYAADSSTGKKYKHEVIQLQDGIKVNVIYGYDANGQIIATIPIKDGEKSGKGMYYNGNGNLIAEIQYKHDLPNGLAKGYDDEGKETSEIIYKNGNIIKQYAMDDEGNRIIPITDKIKLIKCETGFYEYVNYNNSDLLYEPIVKMKWENITDDPITKDVVIKGTFISKNEEWTTETDYFQGFGDDPLQPHISRQSTLESSTGFTNYLSINYSNVYCNIYVNDEFFKKVKISRTLLTSNRIQ